MSITLGGRNILLRKRIQLLSSMLCSWFYWSWEGKGDFDGRTYLFLRFFTKISPTCSSSYPPPRLRTLRVSLEPEEPDSILTRGGEAGIMLTSVMWWPMWWPWPLVLLSPLTLPSFLLSGSYTNYYQLNIITTYNIKMGRSYTFVINT